MLMIILLYLVPVVILGALTISINTTRNKKFTHRQAGVIFVPILNIINLIIVLLFAFNVITNTEETL